MPRQGRNVATFMLLVTALIFPRVGSAAAQDQPPNLRMLLNLDLFAAHPPNTNGAQAPGNDDSMVDQIRTLNALGYLRAKPNPDAPAAQNAVVNGPPPADPPTGSGEQE
jgi:hypothetical protein